MILAIVLLVIDGVRIRHNHGQSIHPTENLKFNEFVANVLRDNISIIIFDLRGCGGC